MLTVLTIWVALAVPASMFVAALGRSGLREEQVRDRVRADARPRAAAEPVARRSEDAATQVAVADVAVCPDSRAAC